MKSLTFVLIAIVLISAGPVQGQVAPTEVEAMKARAEIEKAKAEIEKARAEVEKARAEAEKARAEAERAKIEAEKARVEAARTGAQVPSPAAKASPAPSVPEDPARSPGFHRHEGLFLRLTSGPGFGGFEGTGHAFIPLSTESITDPNQKGTIIGGSFSLGGAISDNLILHGGLWFCANTSRKREAFYQDFATVVIGGGFTYYWMPTNFYLSGSVGMAASAISVQRSSEPVYSYEYDRESIQASGAGAMLMAGKEWWVSANWALGAAIQLDFSYTEGDDLTIRQGSARALFTATFN